MIRILARLVVGAFVALPALLASPFSVQAAITVLDQYHLGESDSGAAAGNVSADFTVDSVGGFNLARTVSNFGQPGLGTYTSNVTPSAASRTGSTLAIQFSNDNGNDLFTQTIYSDPFTSATGATDNFGIDAWFKVTDSRDPGVVVYNGFASGDGFGLAASATTGTYAGLFGGVGYLDSRVPVTLNSWVYMAMVRSGGMTSLYVNSTRPITPSDPTTGLPNASITPMSPTDAFGIGGSAGSPKYAFAGAIDEVRVFTFNPGQFAASDLLIAGDAVLGDFNQDGQLTAADIPVMLQALTDLNAYKTNRELDDAQLLGIGDVNGDGVVNNADIQAELDLVAGGGGAAAPVPEPSTLLLAAFGAIGVGVVRGVRRAAL